MDRKDIKERAKIIVRENLKAFWVGYFILMAVSFLLTFAIELLFAKDSMIYVVLNLLTSCFSMTLSVGFYSYLLKMIRKEEFNRNDIFNYVGKVFPILAISLLTAIFSFLWSILFIIPGIIAAISYSFVFLIYVDNNDLSPMECLGKSKEMLNGYKWDYFVFELSFIGWILLCVLIIPLVFVLPYFTISEVLYYEELKKIREK